MNSENNIRTSESEENYKSQKAKSPCFDKYFNLDSKNRRNSASKNLFQKQYIKKTLSKHRRSHFHKPSQESLQIFTIDLELDSQGEGINTFSKKKRLETRFHRKQNSMIPLVTKPTAFKHLSKGSIHQSFKILEIWHRYKAKEFFVVQQNQTNIKMLMKIAFKIEYHSENLRKGSQELQNYSKLDHPSFLRIHTVYQECNKYFLLFDLIQGLILTDFIKEFQITEVIGKNIIKQILQALEYLHGEDIVYGDVRPQNILVTNYKDSLQNLTIKLIDLSFSRSIHQLRTNKTYSCGLSFYAPPEISLGVVNSKYDIWSVGILSIVLFSCFQELDDSQQFEEFLQSVGEKGKKFKQHIPNIPEKAIPFINYLLTTKHTYRPSAVQALKHSWISQIKQPSVIASFRSRRNVEVEPYILT